MAPMAGESAVISIADAQRERSIGIVLTGADADGALGVKAIKSEGGMTLAQTPGSAAHPGMPASAIATGMHIPTLFLDRLLRIKRFTSDATRLFSLIPGHLGRPLSDISARCDIRSLLSDAREVLAELTPIQRADRTEDGAHYLLRGTLVLRREPVDLVFEIGRALDAVRPLLASITASRPGCRPCRCGSRATRCG